VGDLDALVMPMGNNTSRELGISGVGLRKKKWK